MDAAGGISYMVGAMRLLLLLSAFLTALTGAVSGVAAAQPVQASASVAQAKPGKTIAVAAPRRALPLAFAASASWHVVHPTAPDADRASFGERRRL